MVDVINIDISPIGGDAFKNYWFKEGGIQCLKML
jgi:hypothetical protein